MSATRTTRAPRRKSSRRRVAKKKRKSTPAGSYGDLASKKVERALHELKRGQLRSGRSNTKVTTRAQAIAIGLSEARQAGGKVPPTGKSKTVGKK